MLDSTVYVGDAGEGSIVANPLAKNMGENRKGRVLLILSWILVILKD